MAWHERTRKWKDPGSDPEINKNVVFIITFLYYIPIVCIYICTSLILSAILFFEKYLFLQNKYRFAYKMPLKPVSMILSWSKILQIQIQLQLDYNMIYWNRRNLVSAFTTLPFCFLVFQLESDRRVLTLSIVMLMMWLLFVYSNSNYIFPVGKCNWVNQTRK